MGNDVCCTVPMRQVYCAENKVTVGWYCPHCHKFEKAIGREKQLPIHDKEAQRWSKEK